MKRGTEWHGIGMSEDLKKTCLKSNLAGSLDLDWGEENKKRKGTFGPDMGFLELGLNS